MDYCNNIVVSNLLDLKTLITLSCKAYKLGDYETKQSESS